MIHWSEERAQKIVEMAEAARFDEVAYLTVEDLKKRIANSLRWAYFKGRREEREAAIADTKNGERQ